jgi:LPXTG-motif cell wall-anchored protein
VSNDFANLEAPSVQTQVDPSTATLGDLISLTIRVTHPQALQIDPPLIGKNIGTFEVYASTRLPGQVLGDKAVDQFQAALQNFTTGPQTLPGLVVPYHDPMGETHSLKTPECVVTIAEVPPGPKDKGGIRGIKGVIGPTAWSPWWWVLLGALLLAVGIFIWRKRKQALQGPPPPPPVPADTLALEKLEKLAATDWLTTGRIKEYYSAISDIVREYIEGVFRVSALERTTSEIMRDLRKNAEMSTEHQAQLRELLDTCDLVKFAKFRPEAAEASEAHATAVRFVEQTWDAQWEGKDNPTPHDEKRKGGR